jgi:hypothetical protein
MKLLFLLSLISIYSITTIRLKQSASDILAKTVGKNQGVVKTQTAGGGNAFGNNKQGSSSILSTLGRGGGATAGGLINLNIFGNTTAGGATTSDTDTTIGKNFINSNFATTGATAIDTTSGGGSGNIQSETKGGAAVDNGISKGTADSHETTDMNVNGNATGTTETTGEGKVDVGDDMSISTSKSGATSDLTNYDGHSSVNTNSKSQSNIDTPFITGGSSTEGGSSITIIGPGTASSTHYGETSTVVASPAPPTGCTTIQQQKAC